LKITNLSEDKPAFTCVRICGQYVTTRLLQTDKTTHVITAHIALTCLFTDDDQVRRL